MSEGEASTGKGWTLAGQVALGACAVLALIVLVRAGGLGAELYDAYEVRVEGRRILSGAVVGDDPPFRSPLLILIAAGFEAVGVGWVGPALLSALSYLGLIACGVAIALRLGARPWVAALTGMLLASDHLAFVYGAYGMSDVPAAAACGLALVLALAPHEQTTWKQGLAVGAALGVAALLRPTTGLLGLALLGGFKSPWTIQRLALAAGTATVTYLVVSTLCFAAALGSLGAGLGAHGALLDTMGGQFAENARRYGPHAYFASYVWAPLLSSPCLGLLAFVGVTVAWRRGLGGARIVLGWAVFHLVLMQSLVGHFEARYLLPALPALAGLAALAGESLAPKVEARLGGRGPLALVCGVLVLTLAWSAPHEVRRLSDPVSRDSFAERIASEAAAAAGPDARFAWTTTHLFPVSPAVILERAAYPGDPWYGIYHVGTVQVGYHLERPVHGIRIESRFGQNQEGLTTPGELRAYVNGARHADGSRFRAGDVLLVGTTTLSPSWALRAKPQPPFGIGRVVQGAGGLDVELRWITPGR